MMPAAVRRSCRLNRSAMPRGRQHRGEQAHSTARNCCGTGRRASASTRAWQRGPRASRSIARFELTRLHCGPRAEQAHSTACSAASTGLSPLTCRSSWCTHAIVELEAPLTPSSTIAARNDAVVEAACRPMKRNRRRRHALGRTEQRDDRAPARIAADQQPRQEIEQHHGAADRGSEQRRVVLQHRVEQPPPPWSAPPRRPSEIRRQRSAPSQFRHGRIGRLGRDHQGERHHGGERDGNEVLLGQADPGLGHVDRKRSPVPSRSSRARRMPIAEADLPRGAIAG